MKPTAQINSPPLPHAQSPLPVTDYNYHASPKINARSVAPRLAEPALYKLSSRFFDTEAIREGVTEIVCFALITGTCFWPVIVAMHSVTRMVRNY